MYWLSDRQTYKLFITIKARFKRYGSIGLSRLEATRFGISERRMQHIIDILRNKNKPMLVKSWMVKGNNNPYKCNIYTLTKDFIEFLEWIKEFVKKEFSYIQYTPEQVLEYVSTFAKSKYSQWKFELQGSKYIVPQKWKWRWKIYSCSDRRIISLITIQWMKNPT